MEQAYSGKKHIKGFITLISVIIVSGVGLVVVFSSLSINIENVVAISAIEKGKKSKALAESCAEIALNELKISDTYAGNETRNLSFGDCNISTVSGSGNTNRGFQVSSNEEGYYYRIDIVVNTLNPDTIIQSWEEI